MPKFKLKSFILIFVIIAISVSFLFLKINEKFKHRDFVDENITEESALDLIELSAKHSSQIKKFGNLDDFSSFISKNALNFDNKYLKRSSLETSLMDMAMPISESLGSDSMIADIDFSTTNIQVQGVDEADIVKTDGNYIYYASGQNLYILESYPAEDLKIVSKIEFESYLSDIYVKDNVMVAFGNKNRDYGVSKERSFVDIMPPYYSGSVFLKIFDISNRAKPIQEKELEIDGSYFNSRLVDNHLYFLVNNYNFYDTRLPKIVYKENELNFNCSGGLNCVSPNIFYLDERYDGFNLTSVISLDLKNLSKDPKFNFYLLPSSQNMYVSRENIYVIYTKYLNEYEIETETLINLVYSKLSEKDRAVVDEINATSENVLSLSEKISKIRRIIDAYVNFLSLAEKESLELELKNKIIEEYPDILDEMEKTVIHKLNIFEGFVEPIFMAEVPGRVLNQFSMDEFDGFFRIATTRSRAWSRFFEESSESHNNIFVLDSDLRLTGKVEGLAEGERIYSARFMGDKAYVVTFRDTDPLFSIDLKDPYNPKVLGELKIPGFSNYLHPYDNKTLIGLGKDVFENEDGRFVEGGLKLSLFDVSSDDPVEVDTYIIGDSGSYSTALHDHKAFLFLRDKNIIAIPAVIRDVSDDNSRGLPTFNGLLVFSINDNKFELKGKIDHLEIKESKESYYDQSVKRSLYIKDNIYSLSSALLKVNGLENLEDVSYILLK